MIVTLAKKPAKVYVDNNADLNVPAQIVPNEISWGNGPNGPKPAKVRRAEQLLEKGLAVKEKIYDMMLGEDAAFLRRVMTAKPEAALNLLGRILPKDDITDNRREEKMPVLIINNTGPQPITIDAA